MKRSGKDTTINSDDELHQPSEFLVEVTGLLPHGRALDVAMGSGRNAVYLATLGFEVEGVDSSRKAIEEALSLAQEKGISIRTRVEDLEKVPYFEEGLMT